MSEKHHEFQKSIGSRLMITMTLNFFITIIELIGGIFSSSLSLISDALHNFSDGISIIISYIAIKLKQRERSFKHTFGLKRAEILAAVINSAILVVISFYLFYESVLKLIYPEEIKGLVMMMVAAVGFISNIIGTILLKRDASHSLNIKSSYLHLLSDAVSSFAVVIGGFVIYLWGAYWVDPLLTILIGIYILKESFSILSDAIHVLMEGAPNDLSLKQVKEEVERIVNVQDMHHLHLWMVGENDIHMEAHINVEDMMVSDCDKLRINIEKMLKEKFNINHITLQFECNQCPNEGLIKNGSPV